MQDKTCDVQTEKNQTCSSGLTLWYGVAPRQMQPKYSPSSKCKRHVLNQIGKGRGITVFA